MVHIHMIFDLDRSFEFYFKLHCFFQTDLLNLLADVLLVIGAVLIGYVTCMLQQGFGPSFFSRMVTFYL